MELKKVKRICSFSVSNWHLITMIIPYLNKELENEHPICTFFETDMEEIIKEFLKKLTLKNELKNELANLNWSSNKKYKYTQIEEQLNNINNKNTHYIFINGDLNFIKEANYLVEETNKDVKINIINCYNIVEFNKNIIDILNSTDKILNTSGEHEIEEIFPEYVKEKKKA